MGRSLLVSRVHLNDTLAEGLSAVLTGGQVWLKAGSCAAGDSVPVTINQAVTL